MVRRQNNKPRLVPRLVQRTERRVEREEKMKRKAAAVVIATAIFLSGCGSSGVSKKETEVQPTTEHIYVDTLQTATNATQFWKSAPTYLPIVKYEDIISGEFEGKYVLIDGVVKSVDQGFPSSDSLNLKVLFKKQNGRYYEQPYYWLHQTDAPYYDDFSSSGARGDIVRMCLNVGSTFYMSDVIGLHNTGESVDMSSVNIETEKVTEVQTDAQISSNPFLSNPESTGIVKSGSGDIIGYYSYISMARSEFDSVTPEEYQEFCDHVQSQGSARNWYSVLFDDGTALLFPGCNTAIGTIGHQDGEGSVSDAISYVQLQDGKIVITDAQQGGE